MMEWNFNIDEAPKGRTITEKEISNKGKVFERERFIPDRILICVDDGQEWVGYSHWIPLHANGKDGNRWEFIASDQKPLAWMYPPKHPKA